MKTNWNKLHENFINNGLKIFPVQSNGKTPLIPKWQEDCSCELMQVLYWYETAPGCNWALPATQNNLFIIDLDVHDENKNGIQYFKKLMEDIGLSNMDTIKQETPSGGMHLIFKTDEDLKQVPNCSNAFEHYPGIDIRTDGYIVVEPSVINGKEYTFYGMNEPQVIPEKLKKFILENVGTKEERKKSQYTKPKEVYKGDRDNQLFQYINNLYYKTRLDYEEIVLLANNFNENVLEEPFSEKTVTYKVKKAFEKDRGTCLFINMRGEDNG